MSPSTGNDSCEVLKITVYRETVYVRLDEVDFLMEAENIDDFPENYRPLLSIRGTPFIIHGSQFIERRSM
ncbi:hypothetical protein ASAP_0906 [Asaia bogorensis]|uniref:Uncharacterized protein n=1 Tax=Asaia bogorensis TaxID=91915 RepID=A0A060QI81_9PROT|nr:hypothetical protein ASAP_0906 [Asaia bogorensis]